MVGVRQPWAAPTYYLANFHRNLHENGEILGQMGDAHPSRPIDPPMPWYNYVLLMGTQLWTYVRLTRFVKITTLPGTVAFFTTSTPDTYAISDRYKWQFFSFTEFKFYI